MFAAAAAVTAMAAWGNENNADCRWEATPLFLVAA